jgi:hypothetical protein
LASASTFRPRGLELAVMGVAGAFILGELTGWLILAGAYLLQGPQLLRELKEKRPQPEPRRQLAGRLISLAVPAVVATILWPVMQLADSLLVPLRLQAAGFDPAAVREGLGHLGMALTLAQFPNIVTVALATSLVPAISEAWALARDRLVKHRAEEALRMALIFGIPSCAALYVLAEPLCQILFSYGQVGEPLRILAAGTVTLGVIQATTGVLQGLGAMAVPVRNLCSLGVLLKFALNFLFCWPSPGWACLGRRLEHHSEPGRWSRPAQPGLRLSPGGQGGQLGASPCCYPALAAAGTSLSCCTSSRTPWPAFCQVVQPACGLRSSGLRPHPLFPAADHDLGQLYSGGIVDLLPGA